MVNPKSERTAALKKFREEILDSSCPEIRKKEKKREE